MLKSIRVHCFVVGLGLASTLLAAPPMVRSFGETSGLEFGNTQAIVQDRAGFIWFAADAGLVRFDGRAAQVFSPSPEPCPALSVALDDAGIFASDACGAAFFVDNEAVNGTPKLALSASAGVVQTSASFANARYVVIANQLLRLNATQLIPIALAAPIAEPITPPGSAFPRLFAVGCGVVLATKENAYLISPHIDEARPLGVHNVAAATGCTNTKPLTLLTRFPGHLMAAQSLNPPKFEQLHSENNRGIGLAYRNGRLWVAYDIHVLAFDGGRQVLRYPQSREIPSGGALLVDSEQSLWIGSISKVLQLPEPDTLHLDTTDGLVSAHSLAIIDEPWRKQAAPLVITWQGAHRLHREVASLAAKGASVTTVGALLDVDGIACSGEFGTWFSDGSQRDSVQTRWRLDRPQGTVRLRNSAGVSGSLWSCADAQGRHFAAGKAGLLELDLAQTAVIRHRAAFSNQPNAVPGLSIVAAHGDVLWLTQADQACQFDIQRLSGEPRRCMSCKGARKIESLMPLIERDGAAETVSWLAVAAPLGVVRLRSNKCERLTVAGINRSQIEGIKRAHDGNYWIYGSNLLAKATLSRAGQFALLQAFGAESGLTQTSVISMLEETDGLWIANIEGISRIPMSKAGSHFQNSIGQLAPIQARADGLAIMHKNLLSANTRAVELELAGLSFKAPDRLRYRYRINAGAYSEATPNPRLTLTNLLPGLYEVNAQFTDDGTRWSAERAFQFSIRTPWFKTPWAYGAAIAAVLAAFGIAQNMRRQRWRLLRQQREEIAADLHDELGSELASVRITADLLKQNGLSATDRDELLRDLSQGASELSSNLRSLVDSMKQTVLDTSLQALGDDMQSLANRLFPNIDLRCEIRLASPHRNLRAVTWRALHLIASEAMTNAARHAHASFVHLQLCVSADQLSWRLTDHGKGFVVDEKPGNGLNHMSVRAAKLGAQFLVQSEPGHGTTITLELHLGSSA